MIINHNIIYVYILGIKLIGLPKITNNKGIEIIKSNGGMFEAIC